MLDLGRPLDERGDDRTFDVLGREELGKPFLRLLVVSSKKSTISFGAGMQNDVPGMAERFAPRINFVHLRNVSRNAEGDFLEEDHLSGDVDMFSVMRTLLQEQKRRRQEGRGDLRLPMRPDHGHLMLPDLQRKGIYPGYSLFGRMRGLAELRGLELGIRRALDL